MMPAPVTCVDGESTVALPPNPRAGSLKVDRDRAVERCARLLLAAPEIGLDHCWRYAAGFELGAWRRSIGLEVLARLLELVHRETFAI